MPASWAMASSWSTPGMSGMSGKCPWKKGSLIVTFLIPTARRKPSTSITRSMSRKG